MAVNVVGLVAVVVFYALVAVVGIFAARLTRNRKSASESETIAVGARDIGKVLGLFTMTATFFGGGAINGCAESIYNPSMGLLWTIAMFGYGTGLAINGIFFARKMREGNYVTVIDPMELKFGKYSSVVFVTVEVFSNTTYIASILTALGGTLEVVTSLPRIPSVIISALIAMLYTILGGIYSVAYTDVIQLTAIVVGLVLAAPFALTHEAVTSIWETAQGDGGWLGTWDLTYAGSYADLWLTMIFGGIPLQIGQQRILSAKTTRNAQMQCVGAGFLLFILSVPPILIGAAGASTNWSMTSYMNGSGISPAELGDGNLILPIVLQYLTPPAVAFLGLGAVSAAVMSSADSNMLASGTIFGRNVYKKSIRPKASDHEVLNAIRISIFLTTAASTVMSLASDSIIELVYLNLDFMFIITFPQLLSVLYLNPNAYGLVPAIIIGFVMRLGGGERMLDWDPLFPSVGGTNFPLKTIAMISSFITLNVISYLAKVLFEGGYIPERYDFLRANLFRGGRTIHIGKKDEKKKTGVDLRSSGINLQVEDTDDKDIRSGFI